MYRESIFPTGPCSGYFKKKVCGEAKSVGQATVEYASWQRRLHTILNEYEPSDVFNADETVLFYRAMPDRTLEYKSVQCYGHKVNKERLGVMVCANMAGTETLPLLVLGGEK